MTLLSMRRHVASVARYYNVALVEFKPMPRRYGVSFMPRRVAVVAPVRTQIDYAVALHEIAHCHLGSRRDREHVCAYEGRVWDFARECARPWTRQMERTRRSCLATYAPKLPVATQRKR